jgi:hypothetical protein
VGDEGDGLKKLELDLCRKWKYFEEEAGAQRIHYYVGVEMLNNLQKGVLLGWINGLRKKNRQVLRIVLTACNLSLGSHLALHVAQNGRETSVLRIRDVYPGSRIRLFSIPDPGSELSPSRILWIRIKEFKYFKPKYKTKNGFQALENMIRVVHLGSGC